MKQKGSNSRIKFSERKTSEVKDCYFKTIFNNPRHVVLQSNEAVTFQLISENQSICSIHFTIDEHIAYSPLRSLFGGFEISKKVDPDQVDSFYKKIEKSLVEKGVKRISVILQPNFFKKGKYKLAKGVLEKHGFKKAVKYKNHHIEILGKSLQPFMHDMERRKLKKANKAGLEFHVEPQEMLPIIYNFITVCRKEKQQPVNITHENLLESFQQFPQDYLLFTVKKGNEIYASTICVKVNDTVLYNFLPASPARFNSISPMVKLIDSLYSYAHKHNFKYIDLGVSTTSDGNHQDSLIKFKKHMGGKRSTKLKMEKELKG